MKKTLILAAFILLSVPNAAHAQFSLFKAAPKAQITAPTPAPQSASVSTETTVTTQEATEDTVDLNTIKDQPLYVRRQIVADQLNDILMKLNVLTDKTKSTADRLHQNGIATDAALTDLSNATLTLAQAKLSIDALITASNDPKNETVTDLMIGKDSFKDAVIDVENQLRSARQSIITSLASLKAAVSAAVSVSAQ
jgi:hypothetical protein